MRRIVPVLAFVLLTVAGSTGQPPRAWGVSSGDIISAAQPVHSLQSAEARSDSARGAAIQYYAGIEHGWREQMWLWGLIYWVLGVVGIIATTCAGYMADKSMTRAVQLSALVGAVCIAVATFTQAGQRYSAFTGAWRVMDEAVERYRFDAATPQQTLFAARAQAESLIAGTPFVSPSAESTNTARVSTGGTTASPSPTGH